MCCIIVSVVGGSDGIEAESLQPIFFQCYDTAGWIIWPLKTRPGCDL